MRLPGLTSLVLELQQHHLQPVSGGKDPLWVPPAPQDPQKST